MTQRNADKALAIVEGRKHYHGTPCKKYGHDSGLRYVKSGCCVACVQALARTPRRKGVITTTEREVRLKSRYGLTQAAYDALLFKQHGVCAICQGKCAMYDNLCVDHDHETGKTRGLLCSHCNSGIGKLRHDPSILMAAVAYIEQHHGETWYPKA